MDLRWTFNGRSFMKPYGYVKYPDTLVIVGEAKRKVKGATKYGWNRGKLISNKKHIIFEDDLGYVHVVCKDLFFIPKEK